MRASEARRIYQAKAYANAAYLKQEGVSGFGICSEECPAHDGEGVDLHVYLRHPSMMGRDIPYTIQGVKVNAIYTKPFHTLSMPQPDVRPALGGVSISNTTCACAGSLGIAVFNATTKNMEFLSNYHVLALNSKVGDPIVQPAVLDSGTVPTDLFGTLSRWSTVYDENSNYSLADWAVGVPIDSTVLTTGINAIGQVTTVEEPVVGMTVSKYGRTSGLTSSQIIDLDATVEVTGYPFSAVFEHQIIMNVLTESGDSGAICVDESTNSAVGLIFAGTDTLSIATPMSIVMNQANILLTPDGVLPPLPSYYTASPQGSPIIPLVIAGILGLAVAKSQKLI